MRNFPVPEPTDSAPEDTKMAGGGSSKSRKRVEATPADAAVATGPSLVRAKDGSAFARCDECGKSVPVALISMHSCSLDAKIRMNLESQTVEKQTQAKKSSERKRSASSEPKAKKSKVEKRGKKDRDPNAPKRPPTAFFIFMDDFRKSYKEDHPDSKGGKEVAKEGGEKWKSLTDEEKKPYQDKAAELKSEYEKALENLKNENEDDEKEAEEAAEKEVEEISDEE
ncbi:high mobility group B protein 7 [Momordica charantia]|uniref:High mobility group B protein 7 n=1 Tax=Momordica charantia TaxID=3673 RepID=A0A6J1CKD5_MOMCH|nr:high mobility group B protein 7 [Momordica charantia]